MLWCFDFKPPKCITNIDVTFNDIEILQQSKDFTHDEQKLKAKLEKIQFKVEPYEPKKTEQEIKNRR